MFTRRHIKHSRLLLRHARKYLRYKDDLLSGSDREEIVAGMKSLRDALRQKERERIHSTADTLDKTLHRVTPVTWESHWRENCEVILVAFVTAARSSPEAQSTRATRSLWINVATTLLSLIAAMFLSLGRIIFQGFGKTRRQGRHFILSGWPVCRVIGSELTRHFCM